MTLAHARALLLQSFAATIFINVPATDLYTSHWKHVTFQNVVFLATLLSDVSRTPNLLLVNNSWTFCIAFVPYSHNKIVQVQRPPQFHFLHGNKSNKNKQEVKNLTAIRQEA